MKQYVISEYLKRVLKDDIEERISRGENLLYTDKTLCNNIVPKQHKNTCLTIVVEELSELQKEVCKLHRGKLRRNKLIEEIADVEIVIEWLKSLVEIREDEINTIKQEKIDRILYRYANNEFK